jgi:hypothetical protein
MLVNKKAALKTRGFVRNDGKGYEDSFISEELKYTGKIKYLPSVYVKCATRAENLYKMWKISRKHYRTNRILEKDNLKLYGVKRNKTKDPQLIKYRV